MTQVSAAETRSVPRAHCFCSVRQKEAILKQTSVKNNQKLERVTSSHRATESFWLEETFETEANNSTNFIKTVP